MRSATFTVPQWLDDFIASGRTVFQQDDGDWTVRIRAAEDDPSKKVPTGSLINEATNSMADATYFNTVPEQSRRAGLPRGPHSLADQLSLIIPNASRHGPPTSSPVLVNLGKASEPAVPGFPLLTELETRLLPAISSWFGKTGFPVKPSLLGSRARAEKGGKPFPCGSAISLCKM